MDEKSKEPDGLPTIEETTLTPSPKRPKTDFTEAESEGNSDFLELLTFQKPSNIQQNAIEMSVNVESVVMQDAKLQLQLNTSLNNIGTNVTTQDINTTDTESSITDLTEMDMLIINMLLDTDTSTDTSSHDCHFLGKSLEPKTPIGFSVPKGEDGRQVHNDVTQTQAVTSTSAVEDVRCWLDCGYEEAPRYEGTDMQSRALAVTEESNQGEIQYEFCEKSLCCEEMEEVKNGLSFSHFAGGKSLNTKPGESPSSSLAEAGRNDSETLELQNENVASCEGKTKELFNEVGKISVAVVGECAVGSIVELPKNLESNSSVSGIVHDSSEAKKEQAVEELITNVGSETADHTTETQMSARISQEAAEGDNDAAPFCVIDPAVWSETDRDSADERCNSFSTDSVELSPSVQVCKMEACLLLSSDLSRCSANELSEPEQIGQLRYQSPEQQGKSENGCQSHTQIQTSITRDKTSDKSDTESYWRPSSPRSDPAFFHPAEDQRKESQGTMGHELKEQDQSVGFFGRPDHPKAQGVEHSHGDKAGMDRTSEIKGAEVMSSEPKNRLEGALQQIMHEDTSDVHRIRDCAKNDVSECGAKVTHCEVEMKENGLNDDQHSACKTLMVATTEESGEEAKEVETGGHETLANASQQYKSNTYSESIKTLNNKLNPDGEEETVEVCVTKSKDNPLAAAFDAVVPGTNSVFGIHSQGTDHSSIDQHNCNGRFSPVPSAFAFTNQVPEVFDTFEKIQLSPDDDDDDAAGLGSSPLLTSLPGQLLETPQQQLYYESQPSDDESKGENGEGDDNVNRHESHVNTMENGSLSSDNTCDVVPKFVPAADVIAQGWADKKPHCDSAFQIYDCFQEDLNLDSTSVSKESDTSACEPSDRPEFEMKKQFDTVLKEMKLFFDISAGCMASSSSASSAEPLGEQIEALEGDSSNCKVKDGSAEEQDPRETSLGSVTL